jgi:hypothetical protein
LGPGDIALSRRGGLRYWVIPSGSARYDLNLWIGGPFEGATYLPR